MKQLLAATALTLSITLASCAGFTPMHGTQATQAAFSDMSVEVGDGKDENDRAAGYLIRQRLADRISTSAKPSYHLVVRPSSQQIGLGLTGQDFATRFDGVVTAEWTLLKTTDQSIVASGRTKSTSTYSADRDPYRLLATSDEATQRAARDLADRMLTDIALELAELPTP